MGNVTSCSAVDVSRNSLVTIIATADWHQVDLDMAQPTSLSLGKLSIDVSMLRPDSDLFDSFHIKHNQKDFSKWWYIHQGPLEKQAQGFKGLNKGYQNGFSNLSYMFHRKKIRYTFLWVNFIHLIFYYFSFDFGDCHSLICNEQYKKLIKRVIILEFLELEQVWY